MSHEKKKETQSMGDSSVKEGAKYAVVGEGWKHLSTKAGACGQQGSRRAAISGINTTELNSG